MAGEDARYWRILYEVSTSLNSSIAFPEVLNQATKLTADATGAKACSLRLLDDGEKNLELAAAYGLSDAYIKKGPVELERSLMDKEVLENKVVAIDDVTKDHRWQYPEQAAKEGIRSVLSVPLSVKGKTIGTIRIYTSKPHRFGEDEIKFLSTIANQVAIAIANAKLYRMCLRNYQEAVDEVWKKTDVWGSGEEKKT